MIKNVLDRTSSLKVYMGQLVWIPEVTPNGVEFKTEQDWQDRRTAMRWKLQVEPQFNEWGIAIEKRSNDRHGLRLKRKEA